MSSFDPEAFMNTPVEGANETNYRPCPEGDWPAFIKTVAVRSVDTKNGATMVLDVTYQVTDERVATEMQIEEPTVRQSIFLDTTESGALAFGPNKNVQLGKLREAAGQNSPGEPWSFRRLEGAGPFMINVAHRSDKNDETLKYADVRKVVAAK